MIGLKRLLRVCQEPRCEFLEQEERDDKYMCHIGEWYSTEMARYTCKKVPPQCPRYVEHLVLNQTLPEV